MDLPNDSESIWNWVWKFHGFDLLIDKMLFLYGIELFIKNLFSLRNWTWPFWTRILRFAYSPVRPGPAFDCEIWCGATPSCRQGKYCPSGVSRDFSRVVLAARKDLLLPGSREDNWRQYLHKCAICMIYTRLVPANTGSRRSATWAKTFPPIRLSAQNSCQHRPPATPRDRVGRTG